MIIKTTTRDIIKDIDSYDIQICDYFYSTLNIKKDDDFLVFKTNSEFIKQYLRVDEPKNSHELTITWNVHNKADHYGKRRYCTRPKLNHLCYGNASLRDLSADRSAVPAWVRDPQGAFAGQ